MTATIPQHPRRSLPTLEVKDRRHHHRHHREHQGHVQQSEVALLGVEEVRSAVGQSVDAVVDVAVDTSCFVADVAMARHQAAAYDHRRHGHR
jgi:hypothetical protein